MSDHTQDPNLEGPPGPFGLTTDPRRWLLFAAAIIPFVVAILYMSLKPPPERLPRTHGGSQATTPNPYEAPTAPSNNP